MKIFARVKRVLVGDSDFGFVHAVAEDGAEFKVELPASFAKQIARNDVIGFEVTIERIPAPLSGARTTLGTTEPKACVSPADSPEAPVSPESGGAGPGNVSRASVGPDTSSRVVAGEIAGPSTSTRSPRQHVRRSSGSPDPRKRTRHSATDDRLRRLLGLA